MAGLDMTPLVPGGRQVIQGYGDGGFRINGVAYRGGVVVFAERTLAWRVGAAVDVTIETLPLDEAEAPRIDILLVGCGARFMDEPSGLRADLRARSVALEWMDTGAACRTFNELLSENRRAAAALIAVD
jgi:uncharacterized protein